MKKSTQFLYSAVIVLIGGLVFSSAQAHTTQKDNAIIVEMHIEPDDSPVIGQPSVLKFEIEDQNKKFSFDSCQCEVLVKEGDAVVFQTKSAGESVELNFAHKGKYTVSYIGEPKDKNAFQPFKVSYTVNVSRESASQKQSFRDLLLGKYYHVFHYGLFGLGFLIVIGWLLRDILKNRSHKE